MGYDPNMVTYAQADGQMLYEAPPGMMVYEAPPPARFNISPEMFHKLMSGGAVTEQEIHADSSVVSGVAPQTMAMPGMPPMTMPGTEPPPTTAAPTMGKTTSSKKDKKDKKTKKATKVSGKKKGCC